MNDQPMITEEGRTKARNDEVNQLEVNNKVMFHLFMKLSERFDQNSPHTLDKVVSKPIRISNLDLEPKGQCHSKKQKIITTNGTKHATYKC